MLSPDTLKSAFAQIPTSVAVITTGSGSERYGATVGTLGALSLGPPMVMFAMKQASNLLRRLEAGTPIGVNVLATHQHDIAHRFATPGIDRFGDTRWCEEYGLPRIDETLLWMAARVREQLPLGDHTLVAAIIEHTHTEDRAPLLYWRRSLSAISNDAGA